MLQTTETSRDEGDVASEAAVEISNSDGARESQRGLPYDNKLTREIVLRAAKGDERAWSELVKRYGVMVLSVAQRTGLSAADAADIQQMTWVQFMRHADQLRDPERIGAWLATTARRQSQRMAMARARQTLSPDACTDEFSVGRSIDEVEATVLHDHLDPALQDALDRLPVAYRRVLQLLASDWSPSYDEVARVLKLPLGSIGPMRLRALAILRRNTQLTEHAASRGGKRAAAAAAPR
jgi:RNA polymerase sigma factor (sigma-70 family)